MGGGRVKIRSVITAALILTLLAGCGAVNTGASGQVSSPASSPAVSVTGDTPAATVSPEAQPTGTAGEPSAAAGGVTAVPDDTTAGPAATADPDETKQVLDGILDQLNQLDQLYSDMDEVSDDDLTLN